MDAMAATQQAISVMQQSVSGHAALMKHMNNYQQAFSAMNAAASVSRENFKILMTARVEGAKSVSDLIKSAIQKSGAGGG
jgi:hypothetical protein